MFMKKLYHSIGCLTISYLVTGKLYIFAVFPQILKVFLHLKMG